MPRIRSLTSSTRRVFGFLKQKARDEENGTEGIELPEVSAKHIVQPPDSFQCDAKCKHIPKGEALILADGGVTINIIVGKGAEKKTFVVHKSLLRQHSEYFTAALRDGYEDRFVEADRGVFEWPDDEPEQVHRWVRWLYSCSSCRRGDPYDASHVCKKGDQLKNDPNSWCARNVEAEQAFILGDRLLSPGYCRFALVSFAQHVHLFDPYSVIWTHECLREKASLRRFVHAWMGWMKFRLDVRLDMTADEEAAAKAYSQKFVSIDGWKTIDPRKYLPEHWTEPCSLDNRACDHLRTPLGWRAVLNGQPDKETRAVVCSISPTRKMIRRVTFGLWYGCCVAMLVLSGCIIAMDGQGVIVQSAKVLGLVTAIFAFIGTWFCGDWLPLISTLITMLSFASAIFSMQQAGRCFQTTATDTSMCAIQTVLASVQMIYTLVLSGIIFAWDRYDGFALGR